MKKQKIIIIISLATILAGTIFWATPNSVVAASPAITPASVNVELGKQQTFNASGGTPPYTWSLLSPQAGTFNPTQGNSVTFTAGNTTGLYQLRVTDKVGQPATSAIRVVRTAVTEPQCPPGQGGTPPNCKLINPAPGQLVGEDDFGDLLVKIIRILLQFAGAIAVIFLVIGGFRYITAVGSEEAMEKAKKTITGAVIGIVIIVMAFAIVTIINTLLTREPGEQVPKSGESEPTPAPGAVQITTAPLSDFVAGQARSVTFAAQNCTPCQWEIKLSTGASLPSFIRQIGTSGTISVTPAEADINKSFSLLVKATNTGTNKSATRVYAVNVKAQEPGITLEPFKFTPTTSGTISCKLNETCILGTVSGGKPLFLVESISVLNLSPLITSDKKLTIKPTKTGLMSLQMVLSASGGSEKVAVSVRVDVKTDITLAPFRFTFEFIPFYSCPLNDFCDIKIGTLSGGKTPYKIQTTSNLPPGLGPILSGNDLTVSGSANQARDVKRDISITMQDSSSPVHQTTALISIEVK